MESFLSRRAEAWTVVRGIVDTIAASFQQCTDLAFHIPLKSTDR